MNSWFAAAAGLSAFTFGVHVIMGGREIARPLLAAREFDHVVRYTHYYCWHLVTIAIAAMAAAFGYAAWVDAAGTLALFVSVVALSFAVWSFAMIAIFRLSPFQFGQWVLFLPIALLGLVGGLR